VDRVEGASDSFGAVLLVRGLELGFRQDDSSHVASASADRRA
jgi:hypothetical protein